MPLGPGTLDTKGVYKYGEDDERPLTSDLLNIGQDSISEALKFFSGLPASRNALTPAPEGAIWQDTDTNRYLWYGQAGEWIRFTTTVGAWAKRRSLNGQVTYTQALNGWTPPLSFGATGAGSWRQLRSTLTRPTDQARWPSDMRVDVTPADINTQDLAEVITGRVRISSWTAATAQVIYQNPSAQAVPATGVALFGFVSLTY